MEAERTIKPTSPSVWGNTNILALRYRVQGIGSSFFGKRPRETAGHYARTTFPGNVRGEESQRLDSMRQPSTLIFIIPGISEKLFRRA